MQVKIKNYEILKDVNLPIRPGFTVITGDTNNGKSAIVKALYSLFYNKHDDAKINYASTSYLIGMKDGENQVICKRDKKASTKTVYQVNGNTLSKVGRNPVPEVGEALGVREVDILKDKIAINFLRQFQFPFLLDRSSSQLYDFLASSCNDSELQDVLKDIKLDLRDLADKQKRVEGAVDVVKNTLETSKVAYNNIKDCEPYVNSVLTMSGTLNNLIELERLVNVAEKSTPKIQEAQSKLHHVEGALSILSSVDALIAEETKLEYLKADYKTIVGTIKRYQSARESHRIVSKILDNLDFTEVEELMSSINKIESDKESLSKDIKAIEVKSKSIEAYESKLNYTNKFLSNYDSVAVVYDEYCKLLNNLKDITADIKAFIAVHDMLECKKEELSRIEEKLVPINEELATFDTCPLCGNNIK